MPKRVKIIPPVTVKLVQWGRGQWGIAGSLDSGRYHVAYLVGTREDAEAEAERLEAGGLPKGLKRPISRA